MEEKYVYMTPEQLEELRAKVNAIEGVAEIRAAAKASINYHIAKGRYENGEIDIEDVPHYDSNEIWRLRKQYPRAAAFIEAEYWTGDDNPVKVRLGSRACERILAGEDHNEVLKDMMNGLAAFRLAQEG